MALAVDSVESGGTAHRGTTSGTALTWSFTNTAGNLLLVGIVATVQNGAVAPVITAVSYNSVAMTAIGTAVGWDGNFSITQWYYLTNPATGANTVSVTATGTTSFAVLAGAMSFSGADTGTPVGTPTTGSTASGTSVSAGNITTASGNYVVAVGGFGSGVGGAAGSGFTLTFALNGSGATGGDNIVGEYRASTGAAITPTISWTNTDVGGIQAVAVLAAAGGGGGTIAPSTLTLLGVQ